MPTATISSDMTVREVVTLVPAAADIMSEYGLNCFSCAVGGFEPLKQGCQLHGMDDETIDALVEDINDAIGKAPNKPQELIITASAARSIQDIADKEGKGDCILVVVVDEQGGFCLEFQEKALQGDIPFACSDVPEVQIYASVLTLSRIGGATIDVREGRFKLDLQEDSSCCGENKKECGCH